MRGRETRLELGESATSCQGNYVKVEKFKGKSSKREHRAPRPGWVFMRNASERTGFTDRQTTARPACPPKSLPSGTTEGGHALHDPHVKSVVDG